MDIAKTPKAAARTLPWPGCDASGVLSRSYPRGKKIGQHVHREAQLLFSAQGVMQVTTPKGRWLVPPQRAVWLPPRVEHAVDALADIEMRTLLVDPRRLAMHPEAPRLDREFVVTVGPLLRETVLAAFSKAPSRRPLGLLLDLALFELAEAEDPTTFMPMPVDARARRVAELVLADPALQRPLEDLAREAGASLRTVTRLFPAETDLTFKEWRQRARILAGLQALSGGRTTVKQVTALLGYSSVAAFGHAFRQIMGTAPSSVIPRSGSAPTGHQKARVGLRSAATTNDG
ncbi:helix-turn-helix transcriptional regulator [Methylobacterium sp. J-030]|uniref:AraC family transcriptional regulator n=1 Tax=Methylobacterium sp. J-030 TaxID=2836627 RepID=UPI001FB89F76|nr:helix-turn-helix transcriptional regulator [Methylobacterium sp. J-030]MCJ2074021.1 helix-turn-helix transcriptional regulator [Methylobacterium sp. J-030]